MGAIVRVPDFTPGHCGLAFANSFPSQPDVSVRVPVYGSVNIGDASNGVCGGMVFTVLDLRTFARPAFPDTEPPPADSPLFHYIVRRLIDSWDIPNGVLKYLSWMNTGDGDQSLLSITRRGVWRRTLVDEWPKVQAALDAGQLCPLGLVTVESRNPGDLGHNHQVLAYGYDLDGTDLRLLILDPNVPRREIELGVDISDERGETTVSYGTVDPPDWSDASVVCFFAYPYAAREPAPWAESHRNDD